MANENENALSKVFIIEESGEVKTQQFDDPFMEAYTTGDAIEPPYNPEIWCSLLDSSPMLKGCIEVKSLNSVGLGWKIVPKANVDSRDPIFIREKTILETLFDAPNKDMPFSSLMTNIKIDEELTGNGYLEIARSMIGKITGLFHLPSQTMRVRQAGGFIQIRGTERRYFKNFGDKRQMDVSTGEYKFVPANNRANEVIHFKLYYPRSSYYGAPAFVSASPAITGNRLAALRNISFFENDAVPRMVVICNNAEFDDESVEMMKEFFSKTSKGPLKGHRLLVIQANKKNQMSPSNSSVDLKPLTVGVTDDASFLKYQKWNDDELRKIFRIPPPLVGMYEDINKASAYGARRIANEQVFLPDQRTKEHIINQTVVADLGVTKAKIKFNDMEAFDPVERSQVDKVYADIGGLTPNDVRDIVNKDRFDGEWANIPINLLKDLIAKTQTGIDGNRIFQEFLEDINPETMPRPVEEDKQ